MIQRRFNSSVKCVTATSLIDMDLLGLYVR